MKNKYIVFVAMGMELVGLMVACLFIGQKIDEIYGLKGLGLIGFSMAGLGGWLYHIVILAKKLSRNPEKND